MFQIKFNLTLVFLTWLDLVKSFFLLNQGKNSTIIHLSSHLPDTLLLPDTNS